MLACFLAQRKKREHAYDVILDLHFFELLTLTQSVSFYSRGAVPAVGPCLLFAETGFYTVTC